MDAERLKKAYNISSATVDSRSVAHGLLGWVWGTAVLQSPSVHWRGPNKYCNCRKIHSWGKRLETPKKNLAMKTFYCVQLLSNYIMSSSVSSIIL